jgi:SAM-dependent methyltransferase
VSAYIDTARQRAARQDVEFAVEDCRTVQLGTKFDVGICLYDVVGSYADESENIAILRNLAEHVKPGGFILLSVMNLELTERLAKNWFSVVSEPDKLLTLKPSRTMEKTGNIFNPEFYMIDRETKIVYRKEQFISGRSLPEELLVRDRRYTETQIRTFCADVGLDVQWSRLVRAGKWDDPLPRESDKAKEILVLCKKPDFTAIQQSLFGSLGT